MLRVTPSGLGRGHGLQKSLPNASGWSGPRLAGRGSRAGWCKAPEVRAGCSCHFCCPLSLRRLEARGCPQPGPVGVCPAPGEGSLITEVAPATLLGKARGRGWNVKGKHGDKKTEIGWPRNRKGRARYQGPAVVNGETRGSQGLSRECLSSPSIPCSVVSDSQTEKGL